MIVVAWGSLHYDIKIVTKPTYTDESVSYCNILIWIEI